MSYSCRPLIGRRAKQHHLAQPSQICLRAPLLCTAFITILVADSGQAGPPLEDHRHLAAVLEQQCSGCHYEGAEAEAHFRTDKWNIEQPEQNDARLVSRLIGVLEGGSMPPDDPEAMSPAERSETVARLRQLQRRQLADSPLPTVAVRRMNRFQYSNAVQDLFELRVLVFSLPERMLRDHSRYFDPASGVMPDTVRVGSRPLGKSQMIEGRLSGVGPFPQDLRAEHGFDNQADHLTLSPLLMESFLRLSQSVVQSENFTKKTVGIWDRFFAAPKADAPKDVLNQRLRWFLRRAFRSEVENSVLVRYEQFAASRLTQGQSWPDVMKDVAAAVLASPRFLYLGAEGLAESGERAESAQSVRAWQLASRLSFFLWGSCPDDILLDTAASEALLTDSGLTEQARRMLQHPRMKRFCDSFPSQWLHLENIISATPDRSEFPQYYYLKYRAAMHMMLEPLLLFETVLIEDRPIRELLDPDFSYRSDLLQSWYRDGSGRNPGSPTVLTFHRVPVNSRREGGVITNAAVMTMTSGVSHSKPITRGAWLTSVILNDPPPAPPADVPVLPEKPPADEAKLTIRERFAVHRDRPDCAGCHRRIDPPGFALENYNAAGIWRDTYPNGRPVDVGGTLFGGQQFTTVEEFKSALTDDPDRFARALTGHLLRFALARPLEPVDALSVEDAVKQSRKDDHTLQTVLLQVIRSRSFRGEGMSTGG